jgi:23S rRNA (adenine2503-C2)-methyltransferase
LEITTLSKPLRQKLAETFRFTALTPARKLVSSDNQTIKTLFSLPDSRAIEAVLMYYEERQTLCISTQAGCAMDCVFCATGQMGFKRNLSAGEIVEQVLYYARLLKQEDKVVTNIVVMGMGEPFMNYEATLSAVDRLNDSTGFNLGARRFTISTSGLIPKIQRFASEKRQVNLAVSLHAANDELRTSMMPVNRKYPIADLIQACRDYVDQTGRRITFEWALINGVNDRDVDATELASLLKGMICHVNIIPLNPTTKFSGQATTRERALAFQSILESKGIPCTIRLRRGIDIQAGCGQLASLEEENTSAVTTN